MTPEKIAEPLREEQIARLVKSFEQCLRKSNPQQPQTPEQIERTAQEIGEPIQQEIQQEIIDAQGSGYVGAQCPCRCAPLACYQGKLVRRVMSLHGEVLFLRAYYWCAACKQGFCPLDKALDIGVGQTSLSVRMLACRFASLLPFEIDCKHSLIMYVKRCQLRLLDSTKSKRYSTTARRLDTGKNIGVAFCDPMLPTVTCFSF